VLIRVLPIWKYDRYDHPDGVPVASRSNFDQFEITRQGEWQPGLG
jgi:hypothetical protein